MRQQDRVAAFGALEAAVKAQLAAEKAKLVEQAERDGTERFRTDGMGQVVIARRKAKTEIVFEDGDLTDWMLENQPHNVQTVTVVMGKAADALRADCEVVDGEDGQQVIYTKTGEVLPFAKVVQVPEGEPYASWRGGDETKAQAQAWIESRAEELAAGVKAIEAQP